MKLEVGKHYKDKLAMCNVVMEVVRLDENLAWGNMYFVNEKEACLLLDVGIPRKRLNKAAPAFEVAIARAFAREAATWTFDSSPT